MACTQTLFSSLLMNHAAFYVFSFDDPHPLGLGIEFTEGDKPNYAGSFYSKTKAIVSS